MPRGDTPGPDSWMLGSGIHGAVYAAELGLPFCHAYFISADGSEEAAEEYRSRFKPSDACPRPVVALERELRSARPRKKRCVLRPREIFGSCVC